MTSSTRLQIRLPLLFPYLYLILDLCESPLTDVGQQECHAECEQDIRHEKEDNLFEGQNAEEQNSGCLIR